MKLYCLSGLGVDSRAFQNLKVEGLELVHIDWIVPNPEDTLVTYSKRLFEVVNPEEDYYLLGVSFGGMIAHEFAAIRTPKKLFKISSISSRSQLPITFRLIGNLRIDQMVPTTLLKRANFLTYFLFGVKTPEDKKLLKEILIDTDPAFLKWAMRSLLKWKPSKSTKELSIHGINDRMLKMAPMVNYQLKGGHFVIITRGKEISEILARELQD